MKQIRSEDGREGDLIKIGSRISALADDNHHASNRGIHGRRGFEIAAASLPLIYLSAFAGGPLLYNIGLSFLQVDLTSPDFMAGPFVGLANYIDVMEQPEARTVLINTVLFVSLSVVFQLISGFLLALLFMQRFPAASFMRGLFLAGLIMPGLVVGVIWKLVFAGDYGLLNYALISLGLTDGKIFWLSDRHYALFAVIIANIWVGIPFNMLLLSVGLGAIPGEIYEAAKIDGAGALRRFFYMTLPMMRPAFGAVACLGAILTMQQFDLIAALTQGGPANSSQVAQYWSWQLSFQTFQVSQGSAVATFMLLFVILIAIAYVRSIRHEEPA